MLSEGYFSVVSLVERDAEPQQVHGGRVVLLKSNEEGLVVLILAGLLIVLVRSKKNDETPVYL